ncbi:MAG: helix-turn-helix domain-containing protein [Candidatus Cloacimonetes bacterium]|nr:helix-turn-helix domain-containing protein [Candidatus Cloacimonadota bacterium]
MKRQYIRAIYNAVEYFEDHLQEQATIAEAANLIGYSLYHFCRLFNAVTRYSPFHYLIKRRICEAAKELLETKKNISRIAFEYEFNSPETFSRAFRRILGMLPQQWKKTFPDIPENKLLPVFSKDFLNYINQDNFTKPNIIEMPEMKLFGFMGNDQKNILKQFDQMPDYLVSWQSKTRQQKFCFAGFDHQEPDFVSKILPAGKWLSFQHPDLGKNLDHAMNYIHHVWLINSSTKLLSDLELIRFYSDLKLTEIMLPIA